ncbi:winged helix-turn-helix domain-containing protein [Bradyrhizobium sp. S3.2.12]|uniref:ATP-binding protein n=1 Tax=Bradyrhizobium sp. S3.2.12 TaxID=3156387 RepID=UPI0033959E47
MRDTLESIEFGRFRVFPGRRELLVDGRPIRLGGRAFDLLMALSETPGTVVSKDDLLTRVWPGRVVAESSLQTQILSLRQAFGADRDLIRTVAGRGYQFTGNVQIIPAEKKLVIEGSPVPADDVVIPPTNLPRPLSELIGRSVEVEEVSNLVRTNRLVTLTGTGGIGKTRLAFAAARGLLSQFPDGVWLAEFSSLSDPGLVPAAVAAAVGLELGGGQVSAQRVAQTQAARRMLLLLDTCEHVVDAAAMMAEAMLQAGPGIHVVATSREPLGAEGERVYSVPPLAVPAEDAEDLLERGAVRLFIERARAAKPDSIPNRSRAAMIAAICRRLDGIPLAIEMAAARVATLGVDELADRLDDRFHLLTGGRRTALPRHQTLRATLDWSHELLAESERVLLRRLAVFAGAVDLEAVDAVAASAEITSPQVVDGISSLVAKSLVVVKIDGGTPLYHLLDTTRAYAILKLVESGERERLARRHAEYYRDLFERAEAEWEIRPTADWLRDYGRQIDNVRAALGCAFSPAGDIEIGVALTAAAIPLYVHLSLLEECRGSVERALGALAAGAIVDPRREMRLQAALGNSLIWANDASVRALGAAWARASEIAEELDDTEYQLRSLLGLWFSKRAAGELRASLAAAERFCALAASRSMSNEKLIGDRMIGLSQHFIGDQPTARRHLEHMLAHYVAPNQKSHIIRFLSTQRGSAGTFLARSLWLQGFPDQATRTAENSANDVRASGHVNSLCYVLADAVCPIALWTGEFDAADRYVTTLIDLSTRYSLSRYLAFGRSLRGLLVIKRGDIAAGLQLLRSSLDELGEVNAAFRSFLFMGEMAEALGRVGQISEGLFALEEAIARANETEERWSIAELLRIKGELLVWHGEPGAAAKAEALFRQALDWARRQGALFWELRAAMSFARLLRDQDRSADAKALLGPVYARFTEGFDTADLRTARALLQDFD